MTKKTNVYLTLRLSNKDDAKLIYEIKKNALGKYIEQTWGWDEKLQRKFHKDKLKTEPIQMIVIHNKPIGTVFLT